MAKTGLKPINCHGGKMVVFVVNKNGNKLMPCKPAKARKLLGTGKANVENLSPFTIRLQWNCEENVQKVVVGIDKGSRCTGFSCVGNGKILMSGIINHRADIKSKMDTRRANRRQRRNRKWYRPSRFNNRSSSKRSGRMPPSTKANVEEVVRIVKSISLPISSIVVEDVQIDIAKLNNPILQGNDYQKSNKLDENLRLATLTRDKFQCQYCKKKNVKMAAHHIVFRSKRGKDSILNLTTLCNDCHEKVHKGKIEIMGGVSGFKDRIAQRTMQGKTHMYNLLKNIAPVKLVFGYQTSERRKSLGLPKKHDVDALCVTILRTNEVAEWNRNNYYHINFRARQTRRCYYDMPRKRKGRVLYQVNNESDGFRKGDIVLVKGKYRKQINSIYSNGYLAFKRVKGEPSSARPKDCKLLESQRTTNKQRIC